MWFALGFIVGAVVARFIADWLHAERIRELEAELSENAQRFRRLAQDRDSGDGA
jgi:hypothetical protein